MRNGNFCNEPLNGETVEDEAEARNEIWRLLLEESMECGEENVFTMSPGKKRLIMITIIVILINPVHRPKYIVRSHCVK